jgi:prevent-host-death family protein
MDVSVAEARRRLPELVRAAEAGDQVVIRRHGRAVAQIAPLPLSSGKARLGGMRDRIRMLPGRRAAVDPARLLEGGL